MSTLHTKLWRDLTRLRAQVLTIAVVVAIGVAGFVGMFAVHDSLKTSRDAFYATTAWPTCSPASSARRCRWASASAPSRRGGGQARRGVRRPGRPARGQPARHRPLHRAGPVGRAGRAPGPERAQPQAGALARARQPSSKPWSATASPPRASSSPATWCTPSSTAGASASTWWARPPRPSTCSPRRAARPTTRPSASGGSTARA